MENRTRSRVAADFRGAVARRPRLFAVIMGLSAVLSILVAVEAGTGFLGSPLAPKPVESARLVLYKNPASDVSPILEVILRDAEAFPDLAIYDVWHATISGGEISGSRVLSYSWTNDHRIRLECNGPGAAKILGTILIELSPRLSSPADVSSISPLVQRTSQEQIIRPVWAIILLLLGPLAFLALSCFLDAITISTGVYGSSKRRREASHGKGAH